jgi:hypothetical protein
VISGWRATKEANLAGGLSECKSNMADTLVERITGQASAPDVSAEVQIMMPLDTLLDANNHSAADLDGYGPLPADVARDILPPARVGCGGVGCTPHLRVGHWPVVIRSAAVSRGSSES